MVNAEIALVKKAFLTLIILIPDELNGRIAKLEAGAMALRAKGPDAKEANESD